MISLIESKINTINGYHRVSALITGQLGNKTIMNSIKTNTKCLFEALVKNQMNPNHLSKTYNT